MARPFSEFLVLARDVARCLNDKGLLRYPIPLEEGILPVVQLIIETAMDTTYPIEVSCRDANTTEARSLLIRRKDRAEIRYSRTLNLCWRRFSVCKELTHLLFDTDGEFITDYSAMAPLLAANTFMPELVTKQTESPFLSEYLCEYGALELLMPWPLRGEIKKMCAEGETDLEIAHHCKIPETWVTIILRSTYSDVSETMNLEYDKKIGADWTV